MQFNMAKSNSFENTSSCEFLTTSTAVETRNVQSSITFISRIMSIAQYLLNFQTNILKRKKNFVTL